MGRIQRYFTASLWIYGGLLTVSLVLSLFEIFVDSESCCIAKWMMNLGYGILCSTIVSVFVDWGNTRRQNQQEKLGFEIIKAACRHSCKEFGMTLLDLCKERYDNTNERHTLTEWCTSFFQPKYEEQCITEEYYDQLVSRLLHTIERIDKESTALYQCTTLTTNNSNITSEFCKAIHNLQICAYRTYTSSRKIEDDVFLYSLIEKNIKKLIDAICSAFPELRNEFGERKLQLPPDPVSSWGEKI